MEELIAAAYQAFDDMQNLEESDEPVWILGQEYDSMKDMAAIRSDIASRIWVTYRRYFPPMGDGITSDRGWGCMLRCGQMILAEAIVRKHLGRRWRWSPSCTDPIYLKILAMFEDHSLAPYSLHVMAQLGVQQGKRVGEWFGPNTVAHLIKRLPEFDVWNHFSVAVASDNVLIVDETRLLSKCSPTRCWSPLLLFIPQRLGIDTFNPVYAAPLKKFFHMSQCLGILGGTPSHALYIIGYVGDAVVYLDPHTTQDTAVVGSKDIEEERAADQTYHCSVSPRMPLTKLDPSLALCFLCNTENEFDSLVTQLRQEGNSMMEVMDTRPHYMREKKAVDIDISKNQDQSPSRWFDCSEGGEAVEEAPVREDHEAKPEENRLTSEDGSDFEIL